MAKTKSTAKKKAAKVLIVDDHPMVRDGLSMRIAGQADMEVCGEAEDVNEALDLVRQAHPDVIVIDIALKTGSGIELIKRIKVLDPTIPLLAMSMHDESLYAERAIRAGAMGYLNKQVATRNVIDAIRRVLDGQMYLSEGMSDRILQLARSGDHVEQSPVERLSDRELQVFELLGRGFSTREIAEQLHLSPKTIDNYRDFIKTKLSLKDGNELLRQATIWLVESNRATDS
ncbi:MAG: response regulator transcription factor [Planctomycetota bacterium]|nr:response regulator transcription factor [Planctomycetota bacterium]